MGHDVARIQVNTEEEAAEMRDGLKKLAAEAGHNTVNPFLASVIRSLLQGAKLVLPRTKKGQK